MRGQADPSGLRVALLAPCFWPEVRRGMERFTRELADGLLARGCDARLITSHPRPLAKRTVEDGLPILRVPRPPQGRLLRRRYEPYVTHLPFTYGALRRGEWDLVHAVNAPDALAALEWRQRSGTSGHGVPVVLSHMGIPDRQGLTEHRYTLPIWSRAVRGADALVVLSHHAAAAAQHWLGVEARVIHPGVDLSTFHPAPARAARPTIICSAQPEVERKNVGLLVRALAVVRAERPDAVLILSRPRDRAAACRAGVDLEAPGVLLADLDDRAELAAAYGAAWVSALPSLNEGFGLALAEALACGTPAVGFDHGALPEVVSNRAVGRIFTSLTAPSLGAALLEALELATEPATAGRCREHASRFSSQRCCDAYVELYGALLR